MATVQRTLLQKLQALPPRRLAEVEAFVEFLAEREGRAVAAERLGASLAKLDRLNLPPIADEEIEVEIEALGVSVRHAAIDHARGARHQHTGLGRPIGQWSTV